MIFAWPLVCISVIVGFLYNALRCNHVCQLSNCYRTTVSAKIFSIGLWYSIISLLQEANRVDKVSNKSYAILIYEV
jgi:hypothetical protein